MKVRVKIFSWEVGYVFDDAGWDLRVGDEVMINFDSLTENATVTGIQVSDPVEEETRKIIRKAGSEDLEKIKHNREKALRAIEFCREMVKQRNLPMKVVDARFSFEGGKLTFSFIAEKRVDFRDLVRDLSKEFQASIRLQQIGSRDEAKSKGGIGTCGQSLCCGKFASATKSVTIEDARVQQMGQRGSDRLSGLCGRLRCCLSFEAEQYRRNLQDFPEEFTEVQYGKKVGRVVDRNIMQRTLVLDLGEAGRKKVSLEDIKY